MRVVEAGIWALFSSFWASSCRDHYCPYKNKPVCVFDGICRREYPDFCAVAYLSCRNEEQGKPPIRQKRLGKCDRRAHRCVPGDAFRYTGSPPSGANDEGEGEGGGQGTSTTQEPKETNAPEASQEPSTPAPQPDASSRSGGKENPKADKIPNDEHEEEPTTPNQLE